MNDPALTSLKQSVHDLLARDVHAMPDGLLLVSTEELLTVRAQLDGLITSQLQVMDSRDTTVAECGRKTRSWLIEEQHIGDQDASRYLTVARVLPFRPSIGEALREGRIGSEHARVIAIGARKVPESIRDTYVKELLTAAESCDPSELGRFSREIRDRLGGEETVEAAAQRKYDSRWVTMSETFEGMHALSGMLDPGSAATIKAALAPLLKPLGPEDKRTAGQRTADGLVTLAELTMNAGTLPDHGGEKPQVIVTITLADLLADIDTKIGVATLGREPITARTARMIACDAGIIPAVLGGASEVLDLGRRTPTWSSAQRRALRLEDRGCRWPGCRAGLDRCRIHHLDYYSHGGKTSTRNGCHLCKFHHWLVHHTRWRIRKDHHGKIHILRE